MRRAETSDDAGMFGVLRACVLLAAVLVCACSEASGPRDGGQRLDAAPRGQMADAGQRTGHNPPDAVADASIDDGSTAPRRVTGTGLTLTDAALAAVNALTPEQRNRPARCDSGPVDSGIGLPCTPRGGECPAGLSCTAAFRGDAGICTILGCGVVTSCGPGASCCTLVQIGLASLCFPDQCLPSTCLEHFQ